MLPVRRTSSEVNGMASGRPVKTEHGDMYTGKRIKTEDGDMDTGEHIETEDDKDDTIGTAENVRTGDKIPSYLLWHGSTPLASPPVSRALNKSLRELAASCRNPQKRPQHMRFFFTRIAQAAEVAVRRSDVYLQFWHRDLRLKISEHDFDYCGQGITGVTTIPWES